jgi:hypothetical protein
MTTVSRHARAGVLLVAISLALGIARAQSACSSDGQAPPTGLLERFINADCESCWKDAQAPRPAIGETVLDWIVPGGRGEDAPLAAAARRDGLSRLASLRRPVPAASDAVRRENGEQPPQLRVAHGPALNGYIGASLELEGAGRARLAVSLMLVETIPAGTEGIPVERHLVRNMLQLTWNPAGQTGRKLRLYESRPMNIPDGVQPERLQVVGVLEDARGRVRGIARSRCAAEQPNR